MAGNRENFAGGNGIHRPFKHFFKVILPQAIEEKKLLLPEKFSRTFRNELSNEARLETPSGRVWRVGLTREAGERNKVWLDSGFGDFLAFNSIAHPGHLLMFKHNGFCHFKVLICDMSGCEIVYPNRAPVPSPEEEKGEEEEEGEGEGEGEEEEDEGEGEEEEESNDSEFDSNGEPSEEDEEEEISDSDYEGLNPGQNIRSANGKGKQVETGNSLRGGEASGSRRNLTGARKRAAGAASATQGDRGKRPRLTVEDGDDGSSDSDWELGRDEGQRVATGNGASGSRQRGNFSNAAAPVAQTHSGSVDGALWRRLVASKITFVMHFARLSQGSMRAVKEAMDCHNSKRPSLLIVLTTNHISRAILSLPRNFAKYFVEDLEEVRLRAYEGKTRFVGESLALCKRNMPQGDVLYLRKWAKFRLYNSLVEGDVCLFELVDEESETFNVHIFRA